MSWSGSVFQDANVNCVNKEHGFFRVMLGDAIPKQVIPVSAGNGDKCSVSSCSQAVPVSARNGDTLTEFITVMLTQSFPSICYSVPTSGARRAGGTEGFVYIAEISCVDENLIA